MCNWVRLAASIVGKSYRNTITKFHFAIATIKRNHSQLNNTH